MALVWLKNFSKVPHPAASTIKKPDPAGSGFFILVPMAGLEPARLASPPPQDGVSTNSTTSAILMSLNLQITEQIPRPQIGFHRNLPAGQKHLNLLPESRAPLQAGEGPGNRRLDPESVPPGLEEDRSARPR